MLKFINFFVFSYIFTVVRKFQERSLIENFMISRAGNKSGILGKTNKQKKDINMIGRFSLQLTSLGNS